MASGSFRAGKTGRTTIAAQNMVNHDWSVSYTGQKQDTTNFESNGKGEGVTGVLDANWSLAAAWNAAANPLDDPPGLYPRDDGSNMLLYTKVSDAKKWSFPSWICEQSSVKASARGLVTFEASGSNQGDFTAPSGSV